LILSRNAFVGRALKGIATPGMSDSVRNDLLSRLPVRVGDVVTEELWKQTDSFIHSYDEHFQMQFLGTDDGQAELRIRTPNERR